MNLTKPIIQLKGIQWNEIDFVVNTSGDIGYLTICDYKTGVKKSFIDRIFNFI